MQCLFLFRDASGWLPTAQELRQCGFFISTAALAMPEELPQGRGLALAAEPPADYGAEPGRIWGLELRSVLDAARPGACDAPPALAAEESADCGGA